MEEQVTLRKLSYHTVTYTYMGPKKLRETETKRECESERKRERGGGEKRREEKKREEKRGSVTLWPRCITTVMNLLAEWMREGQDVVFITQNGC